MPKSWESSRPSIWGPRAWLIAAIVSVIVGSFFTVPVSSMLGVNVGGALLPVLFALGLIVWHKDQALSFLLATIACTVVASWLASPDESGIHLDPLGSAVGCALMAVIFTSRNIIACGYVASTLGLFIGADCLHLHDLPTAGHGNVGGAGLMDGVLDIPILVMFLVAGIEQAFHIPDRGGV